MKTKIGVVLACSIAACTFGSEARSSQTRYNAEVASLFGPGLFGGRTACGQKLTRELIGVAHRSLPCGTRVSILYKQNAVIAEVVDRGPFIRGRTYDLTWATALALGFDGVATVRVAQLGRAKKTKYSNLQIDKN